ncbi:hypothetical protein SLE2022_280360 [Rubroshorea leprosula]
MEDTVVTQLPEDQSYLPSFCPSFNCYSSGKLVDVAGRVTLECNWEDPGVFSAELPLDELNGGGGGGGGDDFEFVSVCVDHGASTSFPIFNRDLLLDVDERNQDRESEDGDDVAPLLAPLRNLLLEDQDPSSSSSSETDELEGVSPGTYCVWTPNSEVESSPSRCRKSKSTGSVSKRWPRLRDFLRRSNSESKDTSLVFLNHSPNSATKNREEKKAEKKSSSQAKVNGAEKLSAHELFYLRNKALKEGNRRRSYLPYRQDLVGLFANASGLGNTLPPF